MLKTKYIRTKDNDIIVFPAGISHDFFQHLKPISAGFIAFGVDDGEQPTVHCYGGSDSLGLESSPDDSRIARQRILGIL